MNWTHYPQRPLKYLTSVVGGGTPDRGKPHFWGGEIPWCSPKDMKCAVLTETEETITPDGLKNSATNLVGKNSVLMVVRSGILRHSIPVAINEVPMALNQDMRAFIANEGIEPRFLRYWVDGCQQFLLPLWVKEGATVESLDSDLIGKTLIPVPPLPTQSAIADDLDRETRRMNLLMRAKEDLLELLDEKRRALITRAVTRGLNPKTRLRDSGMAWLGQIPAHWELERSKWLFTERDERSTTGEEEMLTVSHITGVTPRTEKDVNMFEAETNEGYKLCQPGDLVINTLWAWMGAMGTARVPGMVSPAYNVYTPNECLTPDYVDALVRIPAFAQEAIRFSKGVWSSRLRLYPEGLYEIWFPVPPIVEQSAIVAHIATETSKLDKLRASAERTIALLKERRAALISAAVTGRIAISETKA